MYELLANAYVLWYRVYKCDFSISNVYTALANNRVGQKTILFDHKF